MHLACAQYPGLEYIQHAHFPSIQLHSLCTTPAGISQRDMTQRFDFLVVEKEELQDALLEFHEDHIMARFLLWDCESPPRI